MEERMRELDTQLTFTPRQDVWVEFEGLEHAGIVEKVDNGWARCKIVTDPAWDYGSISARLAPYSTVAVLTTQLKPRD